MAPPRPYSFLRDVLTRSARFLYLLWGGMLLGTLALFNRVRLPDFVWKSPESARLLTGPWGRGILLGLALAMLFSSNGRETASVNSISCPQLAQTTNSSDTGPRWVGCMLNQSAI